MAGAWLALTNVLATPRPFQRVMKRFGLFHFLRRTNRPKMNDNQRVIVVLGMDRTGTSLVASVLQALGARLGDGLMAPNEFNVKGYFESSEIVALHDQILEVLGLTWSTPTFLTRLQPEWWRQPALQALKLQLKAILGRQIAGEMPFVFKDPRTARLLPLWNDIFKELAAEPVYVLAVRHPNAVAQSLFRRDGIEPLHAELLWVERYIDCLVYAGERIAAIVNYEDWFEAAEETATRLSAKLGLALPDNSADLGRAISTIVRPDLRHHAQSTDGFILPLTRGLYTALRTGNAKELSVIAKSAAASLVLCARAVEYVVGDLDNRLSDQERRAFALSIARAGDTRPPSGEGAIPEETTIIGFIDFVSRGKILGWAFDPSTPDSNLVVELFVAGSQRRITVADDHRSDLQKLGIGKGDHGFAFQLIKLLEPTEIEQVAVYAISALGDRVLLPRSQNS
jgi:hypothetical protein